jgi:hypothetical protein
MRLGRDGQMSIVGDVSRRAVGTLHISVKSVESR